MAKRKLKMIMIDGFKSSYLKHAPYLRSLTDKLQWGELEMPPGHWGGVQILFEGESDVLAVFYKKEGSLSFLKYFKWLKWFGRLGRFVIDILVNIPRMFKGQELFRTGNIPLDKLYKFDISIKKHFAKRKDVDFIYFGYLDSLAHKYGTKSKVIIDSIKKIDREVSKLDFDIIFSDHGMVDIKKIVSVPWTKNCFIDGDIARYWGDKEELDRIKKKLPLENGSILDWPPENFSNRVKCKGKFSVCPISKDSKSDKEIVHDKRFGELIFLVNTGSLIYPNFWDKTPSKAMHGYDGKDKEMKAFYMINEKGIKNPKRIFNSPIGNRHPQQSKLRGIKPNWSKKKDLKVKELHEIFKDIKNEMQI